MGQKVYACCGKIVYIWGMGVSYKELKNDFGGKTSRADDDKSTRVNKLSKAISYVNSGLYSIREVCDLTGYSKNTINKLIHKIRAYREVNGLGEILCPCGKPIVDHKGWCSFRYSKSEKRQEVLKKITIKN